MIRNRPESHLPSSPGNPSPKILSRPGIRWRRYGPAGLLLGAAAAVIASLVWQSPELPAGTISVRKVAEYPHDPQAFCQGLVVHGEALIEGTGQYGRSALREVDVQTGKLIRSRSLPPDVFGEGVTIWKDQIIQLTWENGYLLTWDAATFEQTARIRYRHIDRSLRQGWGITHDGRHLIISDGTSVLRFVDPGTWQVVRRLRVHSGLRAVRRLNELEYVHGEILANVWYSTRIARIDPSSGALRGWLEVKHLVPASVRRHREAVLNGIAWDNRRQRLYITGKLWPSLLEITFEGLPQSDGLSSRSD